MGIKIPIPLLFPRIAHNLGLPTPVLKRLRSAPLHGPGGALHCLTFFECITTPPWRSAWSFHFLGTAHWSVFLGSIHHLLFGSSPPRGFFGALHLLGFLEVSILVHSGSTAPGTFPGHLASWVFSSTSPHCFLGVPHARAY